MSLTDAIPVRFSSQTFGRLKAISDRTGVSVAQLVRIATEQYLERIKKTGSIEIIVDEETAESYLRDLSRPRPDELVLHDAKRKFSSAGSAEDAKKVAAVANYALKRHAAASAESSHKPATGGRSSRKPQPRQASAAQSKAAPPAAPTPEKK